jgi:hypothetical protein
MDMMMKNLKKDMDFQWKIYYETREWRTYMGNICVRITYKTGRYAPINENTEDVISHSEEQAVHDLIAKFLHFNPSYKIEIVKTEIIK